MFQRPSSCLPTARTTPFVYEYVPTAFLLPAHRPNHPIRLRVCSIGLPLACPLPEPLHSSTSMFQRPSYCLPTARTTSFVYEYVPTASFLPAHCPNHFIRLRVCSNDLLLACPLPEPLHSSTSIFQRPSSCLPAARTTPIVYEYVPTAFFLPARCPNHSIRLRVCSIGLPLACPLPEPLHSSTSMFQRPSSCLPTARTTSFVYEYVPTAFFLPARCPNHSIRLRVCSIGLPLACPLPEPLHSSTSMFQRPSSCLPTARTTSFVYEYVPTTFFLPARCPNHFNRLRVCSNDLLLACPLPEPLHSSTSMFHRPSSCLPTARTTSFVYEYVPTAFILPAHCLNHFIRLRVCSNGLHLACPLPEPLHSSTSMFQRPSSCLPTARTTPFVYEYVPTAFLLPAHCPNHSIRLRVCSNGLLLACPLPEPLHSSTSMFQRPSSCLPTARTTPFVYEYVPTAFFLPAHCPNHFIRLRVCSNGLPPACPLPEPLQSSFHQLISLRLLHVCAC